MLVPAPFAQPLAVAVDAALEATVVLSFSAVGFRLRRPLFSFADPPPLRGRTVVVTGATSGLGLAAARRFADLGADLVLAVRNAEKAERVRAELAAAGGNESISVELVDMSDLSSVRSLADRLLRERATVDVVVHNAGALHGEFATTADGIERTIATHVVGPFELTTRLLPALRASVDGRVVTVTSGGMYTQRLDVGRLEATKSDGFNGTIAYARAKRAQVVLNGLWAEREPGIGFHTMHPGWADTPGVVESLPGFHRVLGPILRTPDEGADTIVWLAAADRDELGNGGLWLDRRRRWAHKLPWTLDPSGEPERLWDWVDARRHGGPVRPADQASSTPT